jgi:nucleotide-binding universal stress UspA family protein
VDLKPSSARVLDWASHLAEEYQAELTLVHVTSGESQPARAHAQNALEQLRTATYYPVNVRVEAGDASTVVAQLAGKLKADLLVIGRKSAAGVLGRLDMTAYSIIRQSPCPVVSV